MLSRSHAALDRDSQVSKFSYGQFAIVTATETQGKLLRLNSFVDIFQSSKTWRKPPLSSAALHVLSPRPRPHDLPRVAADQTTPNSYGAPRLALTNNCHWDRRR